MKESKKDCDLNNFKDQFVLVHSKDNFSVNNINWKEHKCREWFLYCHFNLPVTELLGDNIGHIGWILGYPIHPDGVITQRRSINLAIDLTENFKKNISDWLLNIDGRYLVLILHPEVQEGIYTDPGALMSVLYSKKLKMVASTINLFPDIEETDDYRTELINELDIPLQDNWYPFGLTARRSVERLLPNHYLNLANFRVERYWPHSKIPINKNIEKSIKIISKKLKHNILSLSKIYGLELTLTAGRDSRILLAHAKDIVEQVSFTTIKIPDENGKLDCHIAKKIGDKFRLNYNFIDYEDSPQSDLDDWQARSGECVAGRTWKNTSTLKNLNHQKVFIDGLGGEVGRSYYWNKRDLKIYKPNAESLITKMRLPLNLTIKERAEEWIEGLNSIGINDISTLDFLYLEQRLGCWAGPQQYGHINSKFKISPFNSRVIFQEMLSLPVSYRNNQEMTKSLIENEWPELLSIPFNTYGFFYSFKIKLKRKIKSLFR